MKRPFFRGALALLLCVGLAACSAPAASSSASGGSAGPPAASGTPSLPETQASQVPPGAAETTLEQKVGQMFFLAFRRDTDGAALWTYNDAADRVIQAIQPGGVCLFDENIHTVDQVRAFVKDIQNACATPPLIGIDQEGGAIQRIRRTAEIPATDVPPMWQVGQTGDTALAERVGGVLGSELTVFGVNLDFAPDCDVFSNPQNTVIGHRAFSSDPQQAAAFSTAVSAGIRKAGVVPVCKHFPGHGDTAGDTHTGYATVDKPLGELRRTDLVPFQAQIDAGAEMIMVAHISLPQVNGDSTPATLSGKVITGLLRGEMGFDGVVITDALEMDAVSAHYSAGEAAVRAVKAGADMLLMPADPQAAYDAVLAAVRSGEIPAQRIEASAARIHALKQRYGILDGRPLGDVSLLGSSSHRAVVDQIG